MGKGKGGKGRTDRLAREVDDSSKEGITSLTRLNRLLDLAEMRIESERMGRSVLQVRKVSK